MVLGHIQRLDKTSLPQSAIKLTSMNSNEGMVENLIRPRATGLGVLTTIRKRSHQRRLTVCEFMIFS